MKPKLYLLLFSGLSIFIFSCRTAKKMYEKGNYDEAVELAAKKLQKDPDDPKLLSIIREAYRYADEDHQSQIRNYSESTNELKWEWMYREYSSLQKMYEAIRRVPAVYDLIKPADYSSYLQNFAEKAADIRFDRGLNLMEEADPNLASDKQVFREAYREFQLADQFRPGQRDIVQKMNEAYEWAVTNIVVLPLQQSGGFVYSGYRIGGQNFDDQLIQELKTSGGNEFTRFYSAWEARSNQVRTDHVMDLQLSRLNIGNYHDQVSRRRVSKEVVLKETVYRPDSIVREYGTVYADITTTRRIIHSDARLEVMVHDANGSWVWSDRFHADHNWSAEFSSYTGDQRALSEQDKQLLRSGQQYPPHEQEITRCLLEQLTNDARFRIKSFFNKF